MGTASEKKPNAPVVIQREEKLEYVDILGEEGDFALDEDLFGTGGDLAGIDVPEDEEGASE